MTEHPEATQYGQFHESKQFAADDQQVVLVDIDETICFYPGKRQYDLAEPDHTNIAKINKLYDEGWKVIYWTARGGSDKSKKQVDAIGTLHTVSLKNGVVNFTTCQLDQKVITLSQLVIWSLMISQSELKSFKFNDKQYGNIEHIKYSEK